MIRHAFLTFNNYRALQARKAELMALDEQTLKDIGLDRSEIQSALVNRGHERRNGT